MSEDAFKKGFEAGWFAHSSGRTCSLEHELIEAAKDFSLESAPEAPKAEPVGDPYKSEAQWIKHFRTHPEAPKVEQELVGRCWVLQRNDFPYAVYAAKDEADAACTEARRKESVWREENKHVADVRVFWNVYPANIGQPAPSSDELLEALRQESWDLRCFDIPTGGDDADIGWRVVGHWMAEPRERVIAEVYEDDPCAAIRVAIAKNKGPQS